MMFLFNWNNLTLNRKSEGASRWQRWFFYEGNLLRFRRSEATRLAQSGHRRRQMEEGNLYGN